MKQGDLKIPLIQKKSYKWIASVLINTKPLGFQFSFINNPVESVLKIYWPLGRNRPLNKTLQVDPEEEGKK